jgi:hypothetical protein
VLPEGVRNQVFEMANGDESEAHGGAILEGRGQRGDHRLSGLNALLNLDPPVSAFAQLHQALDSAAFVHHEDPPIGTVFPQSS